MGICIENYQGKLFKFLFKSLQTFNENSQASKEERRIDQVHTFQELANPTKKKRSWKFEIIRWSLIMEGSMFWNLL